MTILIVIKLFLYLTAFGPMAVLFASVIGLACGLLTMELWAKVGDGVKG